MSIGTHTPPRVIYDQEKLSYAAFVGAKDIYYGKGQTFFIAAVRAAAKASRAGEVVRRNDLTKMLKGSCSVADNGSTIAIDFKPIDEAIA